MSSASAVTLAARALLLVLAALATGAAAAPAKRQRSHAARAEFQHAHPCPATGQPSGKCPGYVIDHIRPLACGGADSAANMQWQTRAEARAKDRHERRRCRHWLGR